MRSNPHSRCQLAARNRAEPRLTCSGAEPTAVRGGCFTPCEVQCQAVTTVLGRAYDLATCLLRSPEEDPLTVGSRRTRIHPYERPMWRPKPVNDSAGLRSLRRVACAAAFVLAFLVAGCGGDAPGASPTTTTLASKPTSTTVITPGSSLTTSTVDVESAVFDSYRSAIDAFNHALTDPPNPDDPLLAQTMVDPMLSQAVKLAGEWRGFGQAGRAPADSVRKITLISADVDGDKATIEACSVDDGVIYEPATGTVLNDEVTTARDRATLMLVDGTWKLASREQLEKWEGVAGCALESS